MFQHRQLTWLLSRWVAAVAAIVMMGTTGCSTRQNQSTPDAQIQNLPPVGSLDDYLAQSSNSYPYTYASYGLYGPFMPDPFWCAPYWYPVPVFPGELHRHHFPLASAAAGMPPPARTHHEQVGTISRNTAVASAERGTPMATASHFGGFGGVGGFSGHMGGGHR